MMIYVKFTVKSKNTFFTFNFHGNKNHIIKNCTFPFIK